MNKGEEILNITKKLAKVANYKLHADVLEIPVPKTFKIINDENAQTIILAMGDGLVQQLMSDGFIEESEFKEHINKTIEGTKEFLRKNNCEDVDNCFKYYKNYNNGTFNYEIYTCDIVTKIDNDKKITRQFVAYFYEPRMKDFYQLTLCNEPISVSSNKMLVGAIDLEKDQYTKGMETIMMKLLECLKYHEEKKENE